MELKPLVLNEPFCTTRQRLKFIARTADSKLIFEGLNDMRVITTDLYGRHASYKGIGEKRVVYNGRPEEVIRSASTLDFTIGSPVYMLRSLSRKNTVLTGVVTGFSGKGIAVNITTPDYEPSKYGKKSVVNGQTLVPPRLVFKTTQALADYIDTLTNDFEKAKVHFSQLSGAPIKSSRKQG